MPSTQNTQPIVVDCWYKSIKNVVELMPKTKGGLTKWFKEDWVDIKTGKKCGRKKAKGSKRPYPACRPKAVAAKMTKAEKEAAKRIVLVLSPSLANTMPFLPARLDRLGLLNPAKVVPLYLIPPLGVLVTPGYFVLDISIKRGSCL